MSVPLTITLLFLAATKSIAWFLIPLVIIYLSFFKFDIKLDVIFVLSLIINNASKPFN